MASPDEKVDMSLDDIIKLNKKSGRGGSFQGQGRGKRGGSGRGRGNRTKQDGLRGTLGGGIKKAKGRGGPNFRNLKNKNFQRQLSGVSPLNRNVKRQNQRQGQNQFYGHDNRNNNNRNFRNQNQPQNFRIQNQTQNFRNQNQPQNFRNQNQTQNFRNQNQTQNFRNQNQTKNFRNQAQNFRNQNSQGSFRNNRQNQQRNFRKQNQQQQIKQNSLKMSLSQKKIQALKALRQARKTLQKIKKQSGEGNVQIGSKRRNSQLLLQSDQPPVKKRRQWRQPRADVDEGILTVNVDNTPRMQNNRGKGRIKRMQVSSLRKQIQALKPTTHIDYKMEKQLFAQQSTTTLSLSERFKQDGRKVFF